MIGPGDDASGPAAAGPNLPATPATESGVLGIGTDIVEVARIENILATRGDRFKARLFTEVEVAYCDSMPKPMLHYAARFAAKEAFVKALGTGIAGGVRWRDVGVRHRPGGQPELIVTGHAAELLEGRGAGEIHVSLSHTDHYAAATVVIERARG